MFFDAIVVARDCPGANIGGLSEFSVSQIGEMIRFRAFPKLRVLQLDEVSNVRVLADLSAAPQPRERADPRARLDPGVSDGGKRRNFNLAGKGRVANDRACSNTAILANAAPAQDLCERLDHGIRVNRYTGIDGDGLRFFDRDATKHQLLHFALAEDSV